MLDDAGNPIEGVSVVPFLPYPDPRFGLQIWLAERTARTDAQGRFALEGLPRSGVRFEFRRGDGRSVLPYQSLKLGGVENEVKMKSAGMIRGRVVDRDGKPVRNFRILVNAPHERQVGEKFGSYFAGYCGIGITFTSDDGGFVITGLGEPGGLCRISAVADGYAEGAVDRVTSTTLAHLPPADALTIRLGPPNHLRVRAVRDGGEARPVAGARVTLVNGDPQLDREFSWGYHDASWEDMTRGRTDEQGWADFPGLACNEATVLVQAPGFGRQTAGLARRPRRAGRHAPARGRPDGRGPRPRRGPSEGRRRQPGRCVGRRHERAGRCRPAGSIPAGRAARRRIYA